MQIIDSIFHITKAVSLSYFVLFLWFDCCYVMAQLPHLHSIKSTFRIRHIFHWKKLKVLFWMWRGKLNLILERTWTFLFTDNNLSTSPPRLDTHFSFSCLILAGITGSTFQNVKSGVDFWNVKELKGTKLHFSYIYSGQQFSVVRFLLNCIQSP